MDLDVILQNVVSYARSNTTIVLIGVAILAFLTFLKPKSIAKIFGFLVIVVVGMYLITYITDALFKGADQKNTMIYKSRDVAGE